MKILLIEDDSSTAAYVARGLGEAGHLVEIAGEARAGLELALAQPFDVLVVDRSLGPDDGLVLVRNCGARAARPPCCSSPHSTASMTGSRGWRREATITW